MARNVFFSFHYTRDIMRVNTVRQAWRFYPTGREHGYIDHGLWEKVKLQGKPAIKKLIDAGLTGSSVTAVLIGSETADREWVKYEIAESIRQGKGLIGIRIHKISSMSTGTDLRGSDPFAKFSNEIAAAQKNQGYYKGGIALYDWVNDSGRINIGKWVEAAAVQAGYAPKP